MSACATVDGMVPYSQPSCFSVAWLATVHSRVCFLCMLPGCQRHSGTNYMRQLMVLNFNSASLDVTGDSWCAQKHNYQVGAHLQGISSA